MRGRLPSLGSPGEESVVTSVTIIGAGNMARGIATRLVTGGTDVQILAPTVDHATALAAELAGSGGGSATGGGVDDPLTGEVVVLATPYDAALDLAGRRGRELDGKVV